MTDSLAGLAALREKNGAAAPTIPNVDNSVTLDPPVAPVAEKEYQQYHSARIATCLVSPAGHRINFTNYNFYTKDPDTIEYLDGEIDRGMKAISRGERLTADEINPVAAEKRKIIEEFKRSQEGRDFSGVGAAAARAAAGKSGGEGTGMVSSGDVAN